LDLFDSNGNQGRTVRFVHRGGIKAQRWHDGASMITWFITASSFEMGPESGKS
jgi:hypothetical protein